ncbi:MAG: High-affinity branched-chain amino acid transport system permease protein LivH, partial [uncultured Rubrobacteraceae bacterium]
DYYARGEVQGRGPTRRHKGFELVVAPRRGYSRGARSAAADPGGPGPGAVRLTAPYRDHQRGYHRADRARLYASLRHRRAYKLRPRRQLHDRLLCRRYRSERDLSRARLLRSDRRREWGRDKDRRGNTGAHRCHDCVWPHQRGHRAHSVQALAQLTEIGRPDHGHRHVVYFAEPRARVEGALPDIVPRPYLRRQYLRWNYRRGCLPLEGPLRHPGNRTAAHRALILYPRHQAGQGDAGRRAGQRGGGDDGHKRQPHHLRGLSARRYPRRGLRRHVRALQRHHRLRPGVQTGSLRVHGGGPGRHREPYGRRGRWDTHRHYRRDERPVHRRALDGCRDLYGPYPGPGLQAKGFARRPLGGAGRRGRV